jgi:putative spermidine/putrescine transport system substrate-binding protein
MAHDLLDADRAGSYRRRGKMVESDGKPAAATRRSVLRGAAAVAGLAAGSGAITGFPTIWAQTIKDIVIRQIGYSTDNNKVLQDKINSELPFKVEMNALDGNTLLVRGTTQPDTWDILSDGPPDMPILWPTGNFQSIEKKRIPYYDKFVPIFTKGVLYPGAKFGDGLNPSKVFHIDKPGNKGGYAGEDADYLAFIPTLHNADTLGVRPDLVSRPVTSWGDLLAPEFKGRAALNTLAATGMFDAASALAASGRVKYVDKGDMTRAEIDATVDALIDIKKSGQFRTFWTSFEESINFMASGEVVIQSMWAPAVTAVRSRGIPCVYQNLKEGYRCWSNSLFLNAGLSGMKLDAVYEYLAWYHGSGFPGALFARQGYYSAVPETAKKLMTQAEWDYWMEGKPAATDIVDPYGNKIESKGAVRTGGSYRERMGNVNVWNSIMKESEYQISRWNDFLAA